jgi:hypothetical protein
MPPSVSGPGSTGPRKPLPSSLPPLDSAEAVYGPRPAPPPSDSFVSAPAPDRFSSAAGRAGSGEATQAWIEARWNDVVDAAVRAAERADIAGITSEQVMKQVDQLYKDDPGYNPAVRMALQAQLKGSRDLQLLDSMVADAAAGLGRHLREPGQPKPSRGPAEPSFGTVGWQMRPILAPSLQLSLDPNNAFIDGARLRTGVQATRGDLELKGELSGSLERPVTDRDRATLRASFEVTHGPLHASAGQTAEVSRPFEAASLGSLRTDVSLDYAGSNVLRRGDSLGIRGTGSVTQTFGPRATTGVNAEIGAMYTTRNVLAPGDALSIGAKGYFRNNDIGGQGVPEYGIHAGLAYHF